MQKKAIWGIAGDENDTVIKARNKSDVGYGVNMAYDNVMLIVRAFETAATKEQAVDELLKIKVYDGISGRLEQDENGIFNSEATIKKIINGKPVRIREEDLGL